jgi:hypothetical protein
MRMPSIWHDEKITYMGGLQPGTAEDGSTTLRIQVVTSGGVGKILELNEEAARWLVATFRDSADKWFQRDE